MSIKSTLSRRSLRRVVSPHPAARSIRLVVDRIQAAWRVLFPPPCPF